MNVTVKYPKPKITTLMTLKSSTMEDLIEELGGYKEWGQFEWEWWPEKDWDDKKIVTDVRIVAKPSIMMPKWGKYSSATKAEKAEWDRMYKALEVHEDQHYMLFQYKLEKFRKQLVKEKKPMTVKKFDAEWKKFEKEHKKLQEDHDRSTGHGQKQGVELKVPA